MARTPVEDHDVIVFVRIPFCMREYEGDPYKTTHAGKQARERYLDALDREMRASADLFEGKRVRAIYVGGGEASAVDPSRLARILLEFRRRVDHVRGMELSLRLAPPAVNSPLLSTLGMCNYTRVVLSSLATTEQQLEAVGSPHTSRELATAIECLGMFNVPSIDNELFYGIPGQTETSLRNAAVVASGGLGMAHVTLRPYAGKGASAVSKAELRAQFEAAATYLKEGGYNGYAAESFARPGFECDYTRCEALGVDRIGFGLGARSFVNGMSWRNTTDLGKYAAGSHDFTAVTEDVASWDEMSLARRFICGRLALKEGFDRVQLTCRFPSSTDGLGPVWDRLEQAGLACTEGDVVRPTEEGLRDRATIERVLWEGCGGQG